MIIGSLDQITDPFAPTIIGSVSRKNLFRQTEEMHLWAYSEEQTVTPVEDGWFEVDHLVEFTGWFSSGTYTDIDVGLYFTVSIEVKAGTIDVFQLESQITSDWSVGGNNNNNSRIISGPGTMISNPTSATIQLTDLSETETTRIAITRQVVNADPGNDYQSVGVSMHPGNPGGLVGTFYIRRPQLELGKDATPYSKGI